MNFPIKAHIQKVKMSLKPKIVENLVENVDNPHINLLSNSVLKLHHR
jgi:hypothetical protein